VAHATRRKGAESRAVRLFVSSTFRDMHAERDHLVTVVVPELRERVERLGLELVDVDLRWGVPKTNVDGELANPWDYCKKWIERVQPFFVCVLGQRYGRRTDAREIVDPRDRSRFAGMSITEMEVRHAVLDGRLRRRSFFYFRTTRVPEDVPGEVFREFVDPLDQDRLERLKSEIRGGGRPVREYDCRWTGDGFDGLDGFGEAVLEDLWSGVLRDSRYVSRSAWQAALGREPARDPAYADESRPVDPELVRRIIERARPEPPDPLDAEAERMAAFAKSRVEWFQGGRKELRRLHRYVTDVRHGGSRLCVVSGVAGQGKSALLAEFIMRRQRGSDIVVSHFVGATERSGSLRGLLTRLLGELERRGISGSPEKVGADDSESLKRRFAACLQSYGGERRLVLVIDAVNQLEDGHDLAWLPHELGPGVRVVVSCADGDATPADSAERRVLAALAMRRPRPRWLRLGPLHEQAVRAIVVAYLREYSKELELAQIDTICRMEQARNPLFLLVMLNELRTLGGNDMNEIVPRLVAGMRERYPDAAALFSWTIERLEEAYEREPVRLWCSYLALGRTGMSSRELSDLLARTLGADASRVALRIERAIRRYLQRRGPQLDFFHGQLRQAVVARYLDGQVAGLHSEIARYLATRWGARDVHALSELPHHQAHARLWTELDATLTDLDFIEAKCESGLAHDLVADFNVARGAEGLPAVRRARIEDFARFVRGKVHLLARRPALVFQEAANEPDASAPALAARRRPRTRGKSPPWLRQLNKPQTQHPCIFTFDGHGDLVNDCAASADGRWLVSASSDKRLVLWDAQTGRSVRVFDAPGSSVEACAFSPRGDRIVSAEYNGPMVIWDPATGRVVTRLGGQGAPIPAVTFSPDGASVLSASYDGTAAVWDATTGVKRRTLRGHEEEVYACAFSPDGRRIVSGAADGQLKLWDSRTSRELPGPSFGHRRAVWGCAFTPDGEWVVSSSEDHTLRLWKVDTREEAAVFEGHELAVWCCAISPDGARVLSGSADGTVRLWERATGRELAVMLGHTSDIWGCAFLPDGERAVTASWDWTVKVWDLATAIERSSRSRGSQRHGPPTPPPRRGPVTVCLASADGRRFVSGASDGTVTLWDAETGAELASVAAHDEYVSAGALSPDGRWIASGALDGMLRVFNASTLEPGPRLGRHGSNVGWCAFSPDGTTLATCSGDGTLRVWSVGTGGAWPYRVVQEGDESLSSCAFSPDGACIVVASDEGAMRVWDLATGEERERFPDHPGALSCDVSPGGNLLVSSSADGTVRFCDVATRRVVATLQGHASAVQTCSFSPDGSRILSASWDRTVKVWDAASHRELVTLSGHANQLQDAHFTSDGTRILSASMDHTLRLWDAATGVERGQLVAPAASIHAVAFSASGTQIASASHRGAATIWDGASGTVIAVLAGHEREVKACAYSADGARLVTGSADTTLRLWDAATGELVSTLSGHRGPVASCAFSADDRNIVSGSWDSTVRLWNAETGAELRTIGEHDGWVRSVGFLPGGTRVLSIGDDGRIRVWDAGGESEGETVADEGGIFASFALAPKGARAAAGSAEGRLAIVDVGAGSRHVIRGAHRATIGCCAFSSDGRCLATGAVDGELKLWDARSGEESVGFDASDARVLACALSPDGTRLLSGSGDQFLRLWDAGSASRLGEYWAGADVRAVAFDPAGKAIAAGDAAGRLHLLVPEGC
jgi:WD40 repeat protein